MVVSDNTIAAEGLGRLFKKLGRNSAGAGKKFKSSCIYHSRFQILINSGKWLYLGKSV